MADMATFETHVLDWWKGFIQGLNEEDAPIVREIAEELWGASHCDDETDETLYADLSDLNDAQKIYQEVIGQCIDGVPCKELFLTEMFLKCLDAPNKMQEELVESMAYDAQEYDSPLDYLMDLATGGCQNGVGPFVYTDDCKRWYISNIDAAEAVMETIEGDLGEPLRNTRHLPRYVFVAWTVFEETGHAIAQTLFPEKY